MPMWMVILALEALHDFGFLVRFHLPVEQPDLIAWEDFLKAFRLVHGGFEMGESLGLALVHEGINEVSLMALPET